MAIDLTVDERAYEALPEDEAWEASQVGAASACPLLPCPWGEVFDKLTILQLKAKHLTDPQSLDHVRRELAAVQAVADGVEMQAPLARRIDRLAATNERLWEAEDAIRLREHAQCFDAIFVALACAIMRENAARAALKRDISLMLGSRLVEQKHYRYAD